MLLKLACFCHYICWALSSSTDTSSSFIWLLSSSICVLTSSCSGRALLLSDVPSKLGAATVGFDLGSEVATVGLWSDGVGDKVFVEGCGEVNKSYCLIPIVFIELLIVLCLITA